MFCESNFWNFSVVKKSANGQIILSTSAHGVRNFNHNQRWMSNVSPMHLIVRLNLLAPASETAWAQSVTMLCLRIARFNMILIPLSWSGNWNSSPIVKLSKLCKEIEVSHEWTAFPNLKVCYILLLLLMEVMNRRGTVVVPSTLSLIYC